MICASDGAEAKGFLAATYTTVANHLVRVFCIAVVIFEPSTSSQPFNVCLLRLWFALCASTACRLEVLKAVLPVVQDPDKACLLVPTFDVSCSYNMAGPAMKLRRAQLLGQLPHW